MAEAKRKAICEMHTDTRILYNMLESCLIKNGDDEVAYESLNKAIGRNVQGDGRGLLMTARKRIEKEYGVLIECIAGVGLKLTNDYAGVKDRAVSHIRRQASRTRKRILNAVVDKTLDPTAQADVAIGLSTLGVLELCSKPSAVKKLGAYIESHGRKELPTAETLKLFGNKNDTSSG
ncbi:MAG: hypothetical protein ACYSYT_07790 [Planctomycetota bacterium]|jgi:hypothetical protein